MGKRAIALFNPFDFHLDENKKTPFAPFHLSKDEADADTCDDKKQMRVTVRQDEDEATAASCGDGEKQQ